MAIEMLVGLPHLRDSAIVRKTKTIGAPALISANALSHWRRNRGEREWIGWRMRDLQAADGLRDLALDSAGFVAMARYRGFPWSIRDYLELAAAYPFRWFASMDYCVESELVRDRDGVLDRISRTIRVNRDCHRGARDLDIVHRFMPVIQGRAPTDYEGCFERLGFAPPMGIVGVGSMCRRSVGGPDGVMAVFEHLDRVLPPGIRLHGFGIKGTALRQLDSLASRVVSVDSQAYGIAARHDALRRRVSKTDRLVANHMERWLKRQIRKADGAHAPRQRELPLTPGSPPVSPWERAISRARSELRSLIEAGEIDHDALVETWIEQWASDLYNPIN